MYIPSSTKTEHRAVNALENIIDEHSTMEHQINGNDKEMSWDGFIWLFKENNGDQSKANLESRVPVQVKGHNDQTHKYIGKDRIKYSVEIDDLKAYSTEKGVLYFQIFIDNTERDIFYASLFPSKIADYLEVASKKGNKKTISIPFIKLKKDPETLFIVVKQFSDEAKKQGSGYNPLVQDRIRLEDIKKLTSVTLAVVGAKDELDMLRRLPSGDICFYGKTADDKYMRPIEWRDKSVFLMGRDVELPISIGKKQYYERYKCIADSNGGMTIIMSPNLQLSFKEGQFQFKVISTIREIARDAAFLLQVKCAGAFSISTMKIDIPKPSIAPDFERTLTYIVDLYEALEMIGFDVNRKISQLTEEQENDFYNLVKLSKGVLNDQIPEGISNYNWSFGGKYYPLAIEKQKGRIKLYESLYSDKLAFYVPSSSSPDEMGYKMPFFSYYDEKILSNLYNYDYDAFRKQIDSSAINEHSAAALLQCVLILINVFDIKKDTHFLDLADYLLDKLRPYLQAETIYINSLQIKKRNGPLSEDDIKALKSLDFDHEQFRFCKNVLLEDKASALKCFEQFTEEERKQYQAYPIYTLFSEL